MSIFNYFKIYDKFIYNVTITPIIFSDNQFTIIFNSALFAFNEIYIYLYCSH